MVRHSFWQITNSHISSVEKIYVLTLCELLSSGTAFWIVTYYINKVIVVWIISIIFWICFCWQNHIWSALNKIMCWIRSIKLHRSLSYLTLDTFWRFDRNITFCLELNYVSVYCIEAPITHTLTHKQNIACSVIQPILVITSKQI